MLCLALTLALALPAQAIFEVLILDKIIKEYNATPTPAPPPPTPEPTASLRDKLGDFPLLTAAPILSPPTPTPKPPLVPGFSVTDRVSIPLPTPQGPTQAPQQPTPQPKAPATAKPAQKPPVPKGGQQKGMEVTSFGLYFEELRPKLTDAWYMFTPLDLGVEGVMSYPLVAGNAFIVGSVNVIIQGGQVTVTYQAAPGVSTGREFFTLFPSLDDIQTINVQLLAGQARPFGQPINIQQAFGEDRKVILYLNNTVDFNASQAGVTAFVPDQHRFFMQNLLPLLD